MRVRYIAMSHSSACSGFDLEWLRRYNVLLGANTSKAWMSPKIREEIEFLDWDFRLAKTNYYKVAVWHLALVKTIRPKLVVAPDIMVTDDDLTIRRKLEYTDKLLKYTDRAIIPVHKYHPLLRDYELAYPNSKSFSPQNDFLVWEIQDNVTHILGGSPHRQARIMRYFPKVKSVDGNSVFRAAISYGKYWEPPNKWIKCPDCGLYNIFRRSIMNVLDFFGLLERKNSILARG